jgi:hypothetical protein
MAVRQKIIAGSIATVRYATMLLIILSVLKEHKNKKAKERYI